MLRRTRNNILKTVTVIASVATLIAIGSDMAKAGGERGYRPPQAADRTVGAAHVMALYQKGDGGCRAPVMIAETRRPDASIGMFSAARVRFDLEPEQAAFLDGAESQSIGFACGRGAEALAAGPQDRVFASLGE